MDVFTVIFTSTPDEDVESIPWQLSFTSMQSAKLHVIEEAGVCALRIQEILQTSTHPLTKWVEADEWAQFTQHYSANYHDSWMIVRTELVDDSQVERVLDRAGLVCYNRSFRTQDGEPNV